MNKTIKPYTVRNKVKVRSTCDSGHEAEPKRPPLSAKDRDRGEPRGSAPPTPPGIRVRTTAVREVALTRIDQGGETERFEVGIGKPDGEGFAPGDVPWATAAVGRIAQLPKDSQCDQCRTAATWCFPLTPQSGPQPQPDPARESNEHLRRFAEAEKVAPAPHIRGQLFHCRLHADAFDPLRDIPDSSLEPLQRFRRDPALDVRTRREAEPEELSSLRSCQRPLCLVDLELELLRDEARDALHHPLTRAFTANIDVTVIRIANKAVSAALQLLVEFIEHEVTQEWRKRASLRSPFHARADQPVLQI